MPEIDRFRIVAADEEIQQPIAVIIEPELVLALIRAVRLARLRE
jgi:hypothetical protein